MASLNGSPHISWYKSSSLGLTIFRAFAFLHAFWNHPVSFWERKHALILMGIVC
jgi:hypothetical protein